MTGKAIQDEVIERMEMILGPPRAKKDAMIIHEEWADDWKLWQYSHSTGDYSLAAYNHKLSMSGIRVTKMLTDRKVEYSPMACIEHLLPALRRATVLHDLADI